MAEIRPIDEELSRLHQPVIVEIEDIDVSIGFGYQSAHMLKMEAHTLTSSSLNLKKPSALDGFRVTRSGTSMVPSGSTPPSPFLARRSSSTTSGLSSSYSSSASNPPSTLSDPYNPAYFYPSSYQAPYNNSYSSSRQNLPRGYQPSHYFPRSQPQHYPSSPQIPMSQMSPQPYHQHNYGNPPISWGNY